MYTMTNDKKTKDTPDYTGLKNELDELTAKLESGDLDIDEAVGCYERGLAIVSQLQKQLSAAENKVVKLKAKYDADQ
jgi:exodeoxyribonuclease VII small subunit